MKKALLFLAVLLVQAALYAGEHYLTFGLENAFSFRYAEASSVEMMDDYNDYSAAYQETNFSIAPGITFFGRFLGDRGIGGFFRASLLFPVVNYYTVQVGDSTVPDYAGLASSEGTWTPGGGGLMRAFNLSGGISGAIPLSAKTNVITDGGLLIAVDAAKYRDYEFSGFGMVGGLALQSMLGGLRLELGVRCSLVFGQGRSGGETSSQLYRLNTDDIVVSAAPYLSLGFRFGDGIGQYAKSAQKAPSLAALTAEQDRGNAPAAAPAADTSGTAEYAVSYNGVSREIAYKLSKLWLAETFTGDTLSLTFDDLEIGVIAGRITVNTGASVYRSNFKMEIDKNKIMFNNFTAADGSRLSQSRTVFFKARLDEFAESYKKAFE